MAFYTEEDLQVFKFWVFITLKKLQLQIFSLSNSMYWNCFYIVTNPTGPVLVM